MIIMPAQIAETRRVIGLHIVGTLTDQTAAVEPRSRSSPITATVARSSGAVRGGCVVRFDWTWPERAERARKPALIAASVALHVAVLGYMALRNFEAPALPGLSTPVTVIPVELVPRPLLKDEAPREPAPAAATETLAPAASAAARMSAATGWSALSPSGRLQMIVRNPACAMRCTSCGSNCAATERRGVSGLMSMGILRAVPISVS